MTSGTPPNNTLQPTPSPLLRSGGAAAECER